jgi:hypothetical protein
MLSLFDPLAWLHSKGAEALLDPAGHVQLRFDQHIRRVIERWYLPVLRLQLAVSPGTWPRTVQQLRAIEKLKVVDGRYRVVVDR